MPTVAAPTLQTPTARATAEGKISTSAVRLPFAMSRSSVWISDGLDRSIKIEGWHPAAFEPFLGFDAASGVVRPFRCNQMACRSTVRSGCSDFTPSRRPRPPPSFANAVRILGVARTPKLSPVRAISPEERCRFPSVFPESFERVRHRRNGGSHTQRHRVCARRIEAASLSGAIPA